MSNHADFLHASPYLKIKIKKKNLHHKSIMNITPHYIFFHSNLILFFLLSHVCTNTPKCKSIAFIAPLRHYHIISYLIFILSLIHLSLVLTNTSKLEKLGSALTWQYSIHMWTSFVNQTK